MKYEISCGKILISDTSEFSPKHILECGQVFRYLNSISGYKIFSKKSFCSLIYANGYVTIDSTDTDYFVRYFDLERDYGDIKRRLSGYPLMTEAIGYGGGVRILNQDPREMIISFIISANNNIPRIKGIIERLCAARGERLADGGYAFPDIGALKGLDRDFYAALGAGYRADYLVKTVDALNSGFDPELDGLPLAEARKRLMSLSGVGRKVADCILLFGYHRSEVFPVDTWIEKVYRRIFSDEGRSAVYIADKMSEYYGDLAGYAQQYLYYYARENI